MKYLVFAVFQDFGSGNVLTHSKDMDLGFDNPEDKKEEIIDSICQSGMPRERLFEVFVFKSAQNYGSAPEQVAYWNEEDISDSDFDADEPDDEDE